MAAGSILTYCFPLSANAVPEKLRRPSEKLSFNNIWNHKRARAVTEFGLEKSSTDRTTLLSIGLDGFNCSADQMSQFIEDVKRPFDFVVFLPPQETAPFGIPRPFFETGSCYLGCGSAARI
ncbi:hypothetical protein DM02DRAFT_656089 [Periconia macrospinosa]|uniref:Uncharacterized protein n=1 Tax=Periconia macrospinosa TaxID=97972 RepID=A0A2V1DNW7_9PLEO|nr:hypothetical protein DM02DRAFT_656089 [Periconia macrospinosa]